MTPSSSRASCPTAADEAAIEELLASEKGISVGDTITLQNDGCLLGTQFIRNGHNQTCLSTAAPVLRTLAAPELRVWARMNTL